MRFDSSKIIRFPVLGYWIVYAHLGNPPKYEAVSYVWGDPEPSNVIHLMDGSTMVVTASIARALTYLTKACRTGYLWIDQITIDQSNTAERNNQVKIMGEIYSRSSRCLIWLDNGAYLDVGYDVELDWNHGAGEDVLDFFHSFTPDVMDETPRRLSTSSSQSPPARRQSNVSNYLLWFLEHPWFSRTWVYQEFVLAPQAIFLIGEFELPADEIEQALKYGWMRSGAWLDNFQEHLKISRIRATMFEKTPGLAFLFAIAQGRLLLPALHNPETDLQFTVSQNTHRLPDYEALTYADILEKMGGTHAKDDRDHVFAFLGLAPCLLSHMRVDYTLSTEETFAAMMKALIKETKSLDFFGNLPFEADISKSRLRLPSWVPDWSFYAANIHMLCHDNHFFACGPGYGLPSVEKCKHADPPTSNWNELKVAGKIIDSILFTLRPYSAYQVTSSIEIDFHRFSGILPWEMSTLDIFLAELDERGVQESGHISRKALLRTLLMDGAQWALVDALNSVNSGASLYRTEIKTFGTPHPEKTEDVVSVLTETENPNVDALPHGATLNTLHELSKVQYHRRVSYCANGRLALTPDLVEKSDQIAILHGSRVPVLLRRRPNGNFVVIGQCYYDGAMYGEMADPDDDNADIFTLV